MCVCFVFAFVCSLLFACLFACLLACLLACLRLFMYIRMIIFLIRLSDLSSVESIRQLATDTLRLFDGRLDVLVNNASSFYKTPIETITAEQYDDLMGSNFKAPLFLSQACAAALRASSGCIINLCDINATTPLANFSVYCCAKAALSMLTRSLALELAPHVRCNSLSPGVILWPSGPRTTRREYRPFFCFVLFLFGVQLN